MLTIPIRVCLKIWGHVCTGMVLFVIFKNGIRENVRPSCAFVFFFKCLIDSSQICLAVHHFMKQNNPAFDLTVFTYVYNCTFPVKIIDGSCI